MRFPILAVFAALLCCAADPPKWSELNSIARAAIDAKDYSKLRATLVELQPLLPGNGRVLYNLAASNARLGDDPAAFRYLHELTAAGVIYDFTADDDFDGIKNLPEFRKVLDEVEANKKPVTHAEAPVPIAPADLLPEDVAYDARTRRFFVSSVRKGGVYGLDGKRFAATEWGSMALSLDSKRRILWATAAWLPHCERCAAADKDKTELIALNLDTGAQVRRIASPLKGLLGDMAISKAGDIYVSEGIYGGVLRLRSGAAAFERLDEPGEFPSPQNPAVSMDQKSLYIADYVRGIAKMDLATRKVEWLKPGPGIVLSGIDGFYVTSDCFIAIQNGTKPARIVRLSLDLQHQQVLEANSPWLGEPTHGTLVGRDFVFIANGGWGAYDGEGKKKPGIPPVESTLRTIHLSRLPAL